MESKNSITKLNNNNYFVWKFKMQMILTKEKVWKTINSTPPTASLELTTWNTADETAKALIALSVEDNQLSLIMEKATAKLMWDALKDFHEKSTIVNKITLMRNMFDTKMSDSISMEEHIKTMSNYLQKLNGLGVKAFENEEIKSAILLSSLPKSYRTLITSLEARDDLTWSIVTSKLLDESKHRTPKPSSDGKLLKVKNSKRKFCKYCKLNNHSTDECRKKDKKNKIDNIGEGTSSEEVLLGIGTGNRTNKWILDSGATSHYSNDKKLFTSLESFEDEATVADGHSVKIRGTGNCKIDMINETEKTTIATLTNVLYAPDLHGNFISIKCLAKKGIKAVFVDDKCELFLNNKQIAVAYLINDLYILNQRKLFSINQPKKCVHDWHRILGHRNIEAIKLMSTKNLVNGLEIAVCNCNSSCEICIEAKMTRKPFAKEKPKVSKNILDIVYSDLCGPLQTETPSGKRYFLTFIDEFSRYTKVYLLRTKDEVNEKTREFIQLMKTQKG